MLEGFGELARRRQEGDHGSERGGDNGVKKGREGVDRRKLWGVGREKGGRGRREEREDRRRNSTQLLQSGCRRFQDLPRDLLPEIFKFLDMDTIKTLRLTSKDLKGVADERISRLEYQPHCCTYITRAELESTLRSLSSVSQLALVVSSPRNIPLLTATGVSTALHTLKFDFDFLKEYVSAADRRHIVSAAKRFPRLHSLVLHPLFEARPSSLQILLASSSLRHLTLDATWMTKRNLEALRAATQLTALCVPAPIFRRLEGPFLVCLPGLTSLVELRVPSLRRNSFPPVLHSFPSLRSLSMDLESGQEEKAASQSLTALTGLRELVMRSFYRDIYSKAHYLEQVLLALTGLTKLDISYRNITPHRLSELLPTGLQHLAIRMLPSQASALVESLGALPSLRHFDLFLVPLPSRPRPSKRLQA
jgi:F-box domain